MPDGKAIKAGMSLFLFTVLQSIITCPGCSVKEDRDLCPCILRIVYAEDDAEMVAEGIGICITGRNYAGGYGHLNTSAVIEAGLECNVKVWRGDIAVLSLYPADEGAGFVVDGLAGDAGLAGDGATGLAEDAGLAGDGLEAERNAGSVGAEGLVGDGLAPKGAAGLDEVQGLLPKGAAGMAEGQGCWLRIKEGFPCPEIWMAWSRVDTGGDRAEVHCDLHKNHCRIRINLNGGPDYKVRIRGNVCGYGYDGEPYPGSFQADAEADKDGTLSVCVPRQKDNSLRLDLISEEGGARSFAIGNYLAESGYDWSSEDLRDAAITIDYAATGITFSIDKWSRTVHFETVI